MRDSARHAGLAEGRRELASDLYWRYWGVVKAGKNEAGQRDGSRSALTIQLLGGECTFIQ